MAEAKAAQLSLARKDLRHTISCCNQAGATQLLLHCHWPRTFQAVALAPDCGRNLRHSPSHLSLSLLLWKSFNLPISAYLSYDLPMMIPQFHQVASQDQAPPRSQGLAWKQRGVVRLQAGEARAALEDREMKMINWWVEHGLWIPSGYLT